MKFFLLAFLLLLTACASTDPNVLRSQAASIERAQAKGTAQAQAYAVEQETIKQAAVMGTQEAAGYEIERLYAGSAATISAIQAEQDRLDLAMASRQETQSAWADSLMITSTMVVIQAEQTRQPTIIAAEMIKAASSARTAEIVSNTSPFAALMVVLILFAGVVILVWYVARRADLSIQERQMRIEIDDRKNGAVLISGVGAMVYRPDADIVDRAPLNIPHLDSNVPTAPMVFEDITQEPERQVSDPLKTEAIRLTADIVDLCGNDSQHVVGYRGLNTLRGDKFWTSGRWQDARDYLKRLNLIRKEGGAWQFVTDAYDVLLRLNSPTPN